MAWQDICFINELALQILDFKAKIKDDSYHSETNKPIQFYTVSEWAVSHIKTFCYSLIFSPAAESDNTSATDSRGSAIFEDKLVRKPSTVEASLDNDLAEDDRSDNELPKPLCRLSFMGL